MSFICTEPRFDSEARENSEKAHCVIQWVVLSNFWTAGAWWLIMAIVSKIVNCKSRWNMIIPVSVDLNRTVVDSALLTSRQPVRYCHLQSRGNLYQVSRWWVFLLVTIKIPKFWITQNAANLAFWLFKRYQKLLRNKPLATLPQNPQYVMDYTSCSTITLCVIRRLSRYQRSTKIGGFSNVISEIAFGFCRVLYWNSASTVFTRIGLNSSIELVFDRMNELLLT